MGYRYNLLDAQLSDSAAPSGKMNVTIRVRNDGYAPIYNERPVYLVFKNSSGLSRSLRLQSDPRRWLPNGVISAINEQVDIPNDLSEGSYHLYLHLPDKYEAIASDPRYAVRLANEGIWDEQTGMNDLIAEIVISQAAALDPGQLPEPETALPITRADKTNKPTKVLMDGHLYIIMPNGNTYYCF